MPSPRSVRDTFGLTMGHIVPLVVMLVTVPLYLEIIGPERFGALALVWTITSYFNLFGFGLGPALTQALAKVRSEKEQVMNIFLHGLGLSLIFAVVAAAILLLSAQFWYNIFKFDADDVAREFHRSLYLLATIPILAIVGAPFVSVLNAYEKFITIAWLNVTTSTLRAVLPLVIAYHVEISLQAMLVSVICVLLLTTLMHCWFAFRLIGKLNFVWQGSIVRRLLKYGGWVSVTGVISPILSTMDRVIIGSVIGVLQVAYYSVAQNLNNAILLLPGSFAAVLFTRFAVLTDSQQGLWFAYRAIANLAMVMTVICTIGIVLVGPFFTIWISSDFAQETTLVAVILLWGAWFNGLARVPASYLNGIGRPDLMAKAHILELLPYAAVLFAMLHWYGIVGAALSWMLRVVLDMFLLARFAGMLRSVVIACAPGLPFVTLASWIALVPEAFNLVWWGSLVGLGAILGLWLLLWMPQDLTLMAKRLPVFGRLPWGLMVSLANREKRS
ncbi:MAG: flippase [Erythrobacter sp.]